MRPTLTPNRRTEDALRSPEERTAGKSDGPSRLRRTVSRAHAWSIFRFFPTQTTPLGYVHTEMENPYERYRHELSLSDRDPKTIARYWQIITAYRDWLKGDDPDADSAKEYIAHVREQGYAQRSISLYYTAIRMFLDFLGVRFKLRLRKSRSLPQYHPWSELGRIIECARRGYPNHSPEMKIRNTTIIQGLGYTGVRRAELQALRVGDVDFSRGIITVREGKGGHDRAIPIAEPLFDPLKTQCGDRPKNELVFGGLSSGSIYRIVKNAALACGLRDIHPHSLRHMFATRLLEAGANIREVQALLGHQSLDPTAIYLDISADHLKKAVARLA